MEQKNIYKHIKIYQTLPECLNEIKEIYTNKPAITVFDRAGNRRDIEYGDFVSDVQGAAYMMFQRKMAGKHIGIVGENSYEWIVAFCAAGCIGAVGVPIDIEQQEEEFSTQIEYADVSYVIVQTELLSAFEDWRHENIITMDRELKEMMAEGRSKLVEKEIADFDFCPPPQPDTPLAIVYTSGTTSVSKAVSLSHYNMMYNACCCQVLVELGETMFNPLPLYHTYSLGCGVLNILTHGQNICVNGNLKTVFRDLKLFHPVTMMAVPMILENVLKEVHRIQEKNGIRQQTEQALERYKKSLFFKKNIVDNRLSEILGSRLDTICCGGAHLNEKVAEELTAYGIDVLQGYGLTECSPLISNSIREQKKLNSVGRLLPGIEVKVNDGELLVRGPSVFKEYYKNPAVTEESFTNGWFHTGDIGYIDRKGFLYICGRKKNLIVFNNGKKVAPEELEAHIQEIPLVKEVMVYGASTGSTQDDVKLSALVCVDLEKTEETDKYKILEIIQEHIEVINSKLPFYKRIQSVNLSESEFKKTSMQKVRRKKVTV